MTSSLDTRKLVSKLREKERLTLKMKERLFTIDNFHGHSGISSNIIQWENNNKGDSWQIGNWIFQRIFKGHDNFYEGIGLLLLLLPFIFKFLNVYRLYKPFDVPTPFLYLHVTLHWHLSYDELVTFLILSSLAKWQILPSRVFRCKNHITN